MNLTCSTHICMVFQKTGEFDMFHPHLLGVALFANHRGSLFIRKKHCTDQIGLVICQETWGIHFLKINWYFCKIAKRFLFKKMSLCGSVALSDLYLCPHIRKEAPEGSLAFKFLNNHPSLVGPHRKVGNSERKLPGFEMSAYMINDFPAKPAVCGV